MKKIVFALLMTMGMLNAQNNLVFNQVLILDFTNNTAEPYIVPEGKVWKVESATLGSTFKVDGNSWTMGDVGSFKRGPIWIPENSALRGDSSDADFISVLEFDVVPTSTGTGSGSGGGGVSSDGLVIDQVVSIKYETTISEAVFGTLTVPPGKIFKLNSFTSYRVYSGDNIQCVNSDSFMFGDYPIGNSGSGLEGSYRYFTEGDHIIRRYLSSCNSNNVVIIDGAFYHSN